MPVYSATESALDEKQFTNFLRVRKLSYHIDEQKKLFQHYKLILNEHGRTYPTVAGLLLFGSEPQRYFSEAFIICTHFKGTAGRNVIATRDCTGDLFQQADESIAFILSRINREFNIKKLKREERYEIPQMAIREVVINAIIHRDYNLTGPIKIAIYDDRVEIFSPGNFPGPLQTDQLEMGITYIRNPVICKIFREAGYVEKLGSGFLTLFNTYREYHLPQPIVIESPGFIKCILPRPSANASVVAVEADIDHRTQKILNLFHQTDEITSQDVMKVLAISRQTAARVLSELVINKVIRRKGKGRGTSYIKSTNVNEKQ
jgi:ATP-dependent DNA helicase RecG